MDVVGVGARPETAGGTQWGERLRRWQGAAVACATAALVGCTSLQGPAPEGARAEFARRMGAGHRLYQEGEYALAGRRFQEAADYAHGHRQTEPEKRATVAECVSWLRSRTISEFDECTQRLDALHQRARRSERGIGTLLAMGAIAGHRSPPAFRVPDDVVPVLRKAAKAGGE